MNFKNEENQNKEVEVLQNYSFKVKRINSLSLLSKKDYKSFDQHLNIHEITENKRKIFENIQKIRSTYKVNQNEKYAPLIIPNLQEGIKICKLKNQQKK